MALRRELHDIAVNLLRNVPKAELAELIKVIHHFNSKCNEDARGDCLEYGCKNESAADEALRQVLVEKIAGRSQDFYMTTSPPACKCCGK